MAVVTTDLLSAVTTQFSTDFWIAHDRAMAAQGWDKLARMTKSTTNQTTYTKFGAPPTMQDVTHGSLILDDLNHYSYTLPNQTFKAGVKVKRAALEDDQLGEINEAIKDMGTESASHPGRLTWGLLAANGLAFDGTAFFSDTRTLGKSGTIDNKIGSGSGVSAANLVTDLIAGRSLMQRFKDDKGVPMNLIPNTILCPPELVATFWVALNTDQTLAATPMVPQGSQSGFSRAGYTVIGNALLTDTTDWYLAHVGEGTNRPFIFQEREKTVFENLTDINSEMAVVNDEFAYTSRARYAVGYGDPRTCIWVANS